IQHTPGELRHPRRGVSMTRLQRDCLGDDTAEPIQPEHSVELAAEAGGPRGEKKRILEPLAEQLSLERERVHWGSGTLDPPAAGLGRRSGCRGGTNFRRTPGAGARWTASEAANAPSESS